jgi:nicotinamide riboside kinase
MKRIWLCGTHSCGKTTQRDFFLQIHPEYHKVEMGRRDLVEKGIIKVNQQASVADELIITGDVLKAIMSTPSPSISDRSFIDKCAYAQVLPYKQELLDALHLINVHAFPGFNDNDLYFYFPPVVPLQEDGVRSIDPEYRKEIDLWIQFYLDLFGVPFVMIQGDSVQDRHLFIEQILGG